MHEPLLQLWWHVLTHFDIPPDTLGKHVSSALTSRHSALWHLSYIFSMLVGVNNLNCSRIFNLDMVWFLWFFRDLPNCDNQITWHNFQGYREHWWTFESRVSRWLINSSKHTRPYGPFWVLFGVFFPILNFCVELLKCWPYVPIEKEIWECNLNSRHFILWWGSFYGWNGDSLCAIVDTDRCYSEPL